jgi:predicted dehydrogenase
MVDDGALGDVRLLQGSFATRMRLEPDHHHFKKEMGGGALLDRGVYVVSLAHHFLGRPDDVSSHAFMGESGVDEQVAAVLRYDRGALALIWAGGGTEAENDCTLMGSQARLRLHPPIYRPFRLTVSPVGEQSAGRARGVSRAEALKESGLLQSIHQRLGGLRTMASRVRRTTREYSDYYAGNGYHYEAEEVARCVGSGQLESPVMPLSETLAVLETMDRIRSAWSPGA